MKRIIFLYLTFLMTLLSGRELFAQIIVKTNQPQAKIPSTLWGIFFEDINLAADGGLYAELVKNRSFEFTMPLMGWKEKNKENAALLILNRAETQPSNPRFLRISTKDEKPYGLLNEGFRGMGVKAGLGYDFSVWARMWDGEHGTIHAQLLSASNQVIGEASIAVSGVQWKKYAVRFSSGATDEKAKLCVWFEGKGSYDVDMISLFPKDTWKNRPGGLRADLVQLLADLKPGFIRFPGGCIVEGRDLTNRYQWKKTVGNIEDRELIINRWNTEFAHRSTPDYFQSFGLGFFEYFQLAEDIGAEPLPILNCGMACQFNSSELVAADQLQPYIQDALDLIEFANGSVHSKWGALRARMGHPEPFRMKMMGVGNENWGPQYLERLVIFTKAIKDKYPDIKLVNSSGTDPVGERFDLLNNALRSMNADLIDEHYYKAPEWFLQNAKRYDGYDRKGSKVFAGEYAAHTKLTSEAALKNNWQSALAEAAFMTGLERNADVVNMASYAPLFAHIDGWQWAPDLIWFNNLQSYGSPNYYVQQLFSTNKGSVVIPMLMNNDVLAGQDSIYATACLDNASKEIILKLVNASMKPIQKEISLEGAGKLDSHATQLVLKADQPEQVNSFVAPKNIAPLQKGFELKNKKFMADLPAMSLQVIRIKQL